MSVVKVNNIILVLRTFIILLSSFVIFFLYIFFGKFSYCILKSLLHWNSRKNTPAYLKLEITALNSLGKGLLEDQALSLRPFVKQAKILVPLTRGLNSTEFYSREFNLSTVHLNI